ncbi:MAG TPA: FliA/WhiG family RNA polymerase sigma factor [Sedimentisphaerales bacterium]|jgi:RNA polymerase sigma factor for flagellar operon FliA|nr:FliA/WhiG family RNA polymerase sigma factor [Sedimentisphaerales bacterium]HNU27784.1 FliA/WhiG family RNA polymerase sigma factor [Sedimentisphaerales bacterium]
MAQVSERKTAQGPAAETAGPRGLETGIPNARQIVEEAQRPENDDHLKAVAVRTYNGHRHPRIGDDQIVQLLPMVRKIARRAVSYIKPPLSFEDLVSAGTVGLLKAARDFDATHQAEFKTYAYIRIKGAVLDELRKASMLPSGVTRQIRAAREMCRQIAQQTGSAPTDEELARRLDISVEEVCGLFESARAQHFVSIDTLEQDESALGSVLASVDTVSPDGQLEKSELIEQLTKAMQELDERRLQILVLYYQQHLTMKQIAEVLEITESRVSQLHASALFSLSTRLEQWKDDG